MQICGVYFKNLRSILVENYRYYLAYLIFFAAGLIFQFRFSQFEVAVFTFIALMNQSKKHQYLLMILAFLIGFSRIYLLQHFLQDVLAGSFIGLSVSTLIFTAFELAGRKESRHV